MPNSIDTQPKQAASHKETTINKINKKNNNNFWPLSNCGENGILLEEVYKIENGFYEVDCDTKYYEAGEAYVVEQGPAYFFYDTTDLMTMRDCYLDKGEVLIFIKERVMFEDFFQNNMPPSFMDEKEKSEAEEQLAQLYYSNSHSGPIIIDSAACSSFLSYDTEGFVEEEEEYLSVYSKETGRQNNTTISLGMFLYKGEFVYAVDWNSPSCPLKYQIKKFDFDAFLQENDNSNKEEE